ncbi:MAG: hypothetical protein QM343_10185 [Bacillota bacterium]|nr:hypothetical protein [Bacillota bacterium]
MGHRDEELADVVDKLFRVAHGKQGDEDPWQDIAGYGLLGMGNSESSNGSWRDKTNKAPGLG